jgi:acetyl-CoA carboxylase biotin carboxylase subunit
MECRINAEDPVTNVPCPGTISYYYRPAGIGVRVDDFIYSGYKIPPFYDSMIAKIIVHAPDRKQCINRMKRALSETIIQGVVSNLDLHKRLMDDENFRGNNYATNFLETHIKQRV